MFEGYKHTQIGYLTRALLGGTAVLIVVLMAIYELHWIPLIVLIILVISWALFATLTVEVGEDAVEIRFGPGVIQKRFPLREVESCQVVKNPWYYGWGIRLTPRGWLYNVSGFRAVELHMRSGRNYRIGTDDPEALARAIQRSLPKE